jgi:hypothetical protein
MHLSTKTNGDREDIYKESENYILLTKLQDSSRFWYICIPIHICTTCLPAEIQQPQISTVPVILYRYVGKSLPENKVTEIQVVYLFSHKIPLQMSSHRVLPGFNTVWSSRIISTGQQTNLPNYTVSWKISQHESSLPMGPDVSKDRVAFILRWWAAHGRNH